MKLFAGFGPRHLAFALCFSLAVELAHISYAWVGREELRWPMIAAWATMYFVLALVGLACAVATDNLLGKRASTAQRLLWALLAAAVVGALVVEAWLYVLPQSLAMMAEDKERMAFLNPLHRIAYRFSAAFGWALLLVGLYTMVQASRRATAELYEARLAALAAERRMVEADLRAMQARVEPDLLFAALHAVDQGYARSVEEGERALDALIGFLRAALPAEASGTSTVAAEVELVRAYLALVELVSASRLKLDVALESSAETRPIPAMLLLPLVRWSLDGAGNASLRMDARVRAESLELTLRSDAAQAADRQVISGLQERLAQLFAGRARLDAELGPAGRGARLRIPLFA